MNRTYIIHSARHAATSAVIIALLGVSTFFAFEPSVGRSSVENFTVTQTISGAISFLASTSPVVMQGTLDGLSGGTSWGTTTSRVRTNNSLGYSMTLAFASTAPMIRNGGGGYISGYVYATNTSTYPSGFDTSPANSQFGFSVNASNTEEVSSVFKGNGTTLCGSANGSTFVNNNCWRGSSATSTQATLLISSTAPTPSSGSTTTVQFRITIPNNSSPVVSDGVYTATATLTATDN